MPCVLLRTAAPIASSSRSPGMNRDTERITNGVFVARFRSQELADAPSSTVRTMDTGCLEQAPDQAAIDLQRRSRDVGRSVGQQERRHTSELVRLSVATHRNCRDGALALLLGRDTGFAGVDLVDLPDAIGADSARNELVDANMAVGQLE